MSTWWPFRACHALSIVDTFPSGKQCIAVAGAPINDGGWIYNEVFDLPLPYFNAHRQRLGVMVQWPFYVAASNNLILRMFSYILMLIIVVCRILIHECGPLICCYSLMAS